MKTRSDWFMFSSIEGNNNKSWNIIQNGNSITTRWGRVGDSQQEKTWTLSSEYEADREYDKKCKEKQRKGYEKVEVAGASPSCPNNFSANIKKIAIQEIDVDSGTTRKLIEYLTEVNIHQIVENTSITYNSSNSTFTTPLGIIVSQNTIDKARSVLSNIQNFVNRNDYVSREVIGLTNTYLKLIPQNLGRAKDKLSVKRVFGEINSVAKHSDILDSLETSLTTDSPSEYNEERSKVFDCKLYETKDGDVQKEIERLFIGTKQDIHVSSSYKISKIYEVCIPSVKSAWEKDGANLSNIMRLWHGTMPSNVLSIMRGGLKITSSAANGRNFGDGSYYSDISSKSLNYACGYWSGRYTDRAFMFLADVGLGKYYVPKSSSDGPFPKPGYDSIFAQKGKTAHLLNNEIITYRTSQNNLVYLVEFTK